MLALPLVLTLLTAAPDPALEAQCKEGLRLLEGCLRAAREKRPGENGCEAAATAERLVRERPEWACGHLYMGRIHYEEKRLPEAGAEAERALQLGLEVPWLHVMIGYARSARGDRDGAVASFARAAALQPDYAGHWLSLADMHRLRKAWPQMLEAADKAGKLVPEEPLVHALRVQALARLGRAAGAHPSCQRVLRAHLDDLGAHAACEHMEWERGDVASSLAHVEAAHRVAPDDTAWRERLVPLYQALGRTRERDAQLEVLHRLSREGKMPDGVLMREKWKAGTSDAVALEHLTLAPEDPVRYRFFVFGPPGEMPRYMVTVRRGAAQKGKAMWTLDVHAAPASPRSMRVFPAEPSYDAVRALAIAELGRIAGGQR